MQCCLLANIFQLPSHNPFILICWLFLTEKKENPLFIHRCRYYENESPLDSSSNPNSKPQHEQITYVGYPKSSHGGSDILSKPHTRQIYVFVLLITNQFVSIQWCKNNQNCCAQTTLFQNKTELSP